MIEQITHRTEGKHSWDCQRSDDSRIQAIIEKGFWVDKVTNNSVITTLYGSSETDYLGELPPVIRIDNFKDKVVVIFKL